MIYGVAINDMHRGWRNDDILNKKIYTIWYDMIKRCYSEKFHKKEPTYKNCYVCNKWLRLSGFVDDISKIPNYNRWVEGSKEKRNPYQLDKDIKSNGTNKCYCLENCMFVTQEENTKQANKTRDNTYLQGENNCWYGKKLSVEHIEKIIKTLSNNGSVKGKNNPRAVKVIQYDNDWNFIKEWEYAKQASEELNICYSSIIECCKGNRKRTKDKNGNFYRWKYKE